jgi:hypothetical protein
MLLELFSMGKFAEEVCVAVRKASFLFEEDFLSGLSFVKLFSLFRGILMDAVECNPKFCFCVVCTS